MENLATISCRTFKKRQNFPDGNWAERRELSESHFQEEERETSSDQDDEIRYQKARWNVTIYTTAVQLL